jgi:hypothetical protein
MNAGAGYCLQQGAGVVFAFGDGQFIGDVRKNHDSPAAGGYIAASKTKAAAGLWALHG